MLNNCLVVSIVMPAYNVQDYISESISSVLAQTYSNWELIIVDDGSTDETAAVITPFLNNPRIIYIHQRNSGPGNARNTAIAQAQGDYIAFLDADDLWLPEKLAMSLRVLSENNCDLMFTNCFVFEEGQPPFSSSQPNLNVCAGNYSGEAGLLAFLRQNRIPMLTVVVKKKLLTRAGGFSNMNAAEDYEMWLEMLCIGAKFTADATCLSAYRLRQGSLTTTDRSALFESMLVLKSFSRRNKIFKDTIAKILRHQFKHWLYNGYLPGARQYRQLIPGTYSLLANIFLYPLSFMLPFKYLRKLTNRAL